MFKGYDLENQQRRSSFDEQFVRHAFIAKVYSILTVQLLFTFGVICLFTFVEEVQDFIVEHHYLLYVAMALSFVTLLPIACCESVRRNYPINFILLGLFTIAESFLLGCIATIHAPDTVMIAVGITVAVVLALTIFAMQTSIDFTTCGGLLLAGVVILLIFGIVVFFFPSKTMILVYCSLGVFLFSFYLIYDTQMMMGGEHKYSISPEDYIFAALTLYIDIVNLFMYILTLLGFAQD